MKYNCTVCKKGLTSKDVYLDDTGHYCKKDSGDLIKQRLLAKLND